MAHREPPQPGDEHLASDTVEIPAEIPAETGEEITQPIPPVTTAPPASDQTTTGLPLLEVLAPEQSTAAGRPLTPSGPPQPPDRLATATATASPAKKWPPPGALVIGAALAVVLLALLGWWMLRPTPTAESTSRSATTTQEASPTGRPTTTNPTVQAGGYEFTQQASRTDTDCAANAYGQVADLLRGRPCTRLDRALYTTTADGRPAVVSLAAVQMADDAAATELRKLADTSGTGNVSDLLRAGVRVPGGPDSLTEAGYASARHGSTVVIVEADFADPAVRNAPALQRLSRAALELHR